MIRLLAPLLVALILVAAPARSQASDLPTSDTLDLTRIVSLGGNVSETLCAFGLSDHIVGVDVTSVYPQALTKLPQVGYNRQIAAEGVLSLAPTVVIGTTDVGPAHAVEQMRATGVPVLLVPAEATAESARTLILELGELSGRVAEAKRLVSRIDEQLEQIDLRTRRATKPRVLFIYARGGGTMNVAGTGTKADELIRLAGGVNAAAFFEQYQPLTSECVVQAAPDAIFVLDGSLPALGGEKGILELPGVSLTPAGKNKRVLHLEDGLALGFGPRIGDGVVALARLLHPQAMATLE